MKHFKKHVLRKHTVGYETVASDKCVDPKNGVFAVEKSFCGPATPIHVVKNTWGAYTKIDV